jgi:alkylation response protein AidB-like acyl-CoA dehydrogenase
VATSWTSTVLNASRAAATADTVREEVRDWIASNWSEDISVREWWRRLADARYTAPTWPEPYGRAMSQREARVITEELAAATVVGPPDGVVGVRLAGPTLLDHGTEEQIATYLPPLLRGEEAWCQLFSEPGAGSDLPSLGTSAVRDGERWIVNGQKVWNSGADSARRGLLLARTDSDVPKRDGITYFIIDMNQGGVEARPLRTMNGMAHFCEVFLTDAYVETRDVIGGLNDGWRVVRTTLLYERASATERPARGLVHVPSGEAAGHLDRSTGEFVEAARAKRTGRFSRSAVPAREMIALARECGVNEDPTMRQRLATYYSLTEVHRMTQLRARSAARMGRAPGPEGSVSKLALGRICHTSRDLSFDILGPAAMLHGSDAPYGGALHTVGLSSPGVTIGAGTDEIQRNTIGERVLGLPHEPAVDEGVPFRELRTGTQRGAD